jgi:hypothetical protein
LAKRIRKSKKKDGRFLVSLEKTHRLQYLKNKCEDFDIIYAVNSKKLELEFDSSSFDSANLQNEVHGVENSRILAKFREKTID